MQVLEIEAGGYRSIRRIALTLSRVNVIVGPNGCGKTNLYRSLYLLHAAAHGRLASALAEEGGMPSVLWAGERERGAVRMRLAARLDDFRYALECGLPPPTSGEDKDTRSLFNLDPRVKTERIEMIQAGRASVLLDRRDTTVTARDAEGRRASFPLAFSESESVLSELSEPERFPYVGVLRETLRRFRFYHQFRTDAESPLRIAQVGVRTAALASDGRDLAAALQTIREIGDAKALDAGIERAFPGSRLRIEVDRGRFSFRLEMPGFARAFEAAELSDGTLRYLCLLAALLGPRKPPLLALNEPETSLHPDLTDALAHLIARAAGETQLWITTHSERLADAIEQQVGCRPVRLEKIHGETRVVGQRLVDDEDE